MRFIKKRWRKKAVELEIGDNWLRNDAAKFCVDEGFRKALGLCAVGGESLVMRLYYIGCALQDAYEAGKLEASRGGDQ